VLDGLEAHDEVEGVIREGDWWHLGGEEGASDAGASRTHGILVTIDATDSCSPRKYPRAVARSTCNVERIPMYHTRSPDVASIVLTFVLCPRNALGDVETLRSVVHPRGIARDQAQVVHRAVLMNVALRPDRPLARKSRATPTTATTVACASRFWR
jgi:hypothetical protein